VPRHDKVQQVRNVPDDFVDRGAAAVRAPAPQQLVEGRPVVRAVVVVAGAAARRLLLLPLPLLLLPLLLAAALF
jgi:hypothetical protein